VCRSGHLSSATTNRCGTLIRRADQRSGACQETGADLDIVAALAESSRTMLSGERMFIWGSGSWVAALRTKAARDRSTAAR